MINYIVEIQRVRDRGVRDWVSLYRGGSRTSKREGHKEIIAREARAIF
jgi:hypothetical protein